LEIFLAFFYTSSRKKEPAHVNQRAVDLRKKLSFSNTKITLTQARSQENRENTSKLMQTDREIITLRERVKVQATQVQTRIWNILPMISWPTSMQQSGSSKIVALHSNFHLPSSPIRIIKCHFSKLKPTLMKTIQKKINFRPFLFSASSYWLHRKKKPSDAIRLSFKQMKLLFLLKLLWVWQQFEPRKKVRSSSKRIHRYVDRRSTFSLKKGDSSEAQKSQRLTGRKPISHSIKAASNVQLKLRIWKQIVSTILVTKPMLHHKQLDDVRERARSYDRSTALCKRQKKVQVLTSRLDTLHDADTDGKCRSRS